MDVQLSARHDELIRAVYELRDRMQGISRDERLIIEMAIMMLEYLDEYAADEPLEEFSKEKLDEATKRVEAARRVSHISWTVDDFQRLLCSGGFELIEGRLIPRL